MSTVREAWTDERLDDLNAKVENGFRDLRDEMRAGFDRIEQRFEQVDKRFEQVDKRFEQVDKRFEQIDRRLEREELRIDGMQRAMLQLGAAIFAAICGVVATQTAMIVTQL